MDITPPGEAGSLTEDHRMAKPLDERIFDDLPTWEVVIFGLIAAAMMAFVNLDSRGRVIALAISVYSILTSVRISWPLRREIWFWALMVAVSVAHATAIRFVRWPQADHIMGVTLMPFCLLDVGLILLLVYWAARLFYGSPELQ